MKKILIANRGEIAARIIESCQKLGIESLVVYTTADKDLPYVQEADASFLIGEGPVKDSYINQEKILEIARSQQVDGIHPGYGLNSENAEFARAVKEAGMIFIGPDPETILLMGDKISARKVMKQAGVPVVPGSDEELLDLEQAIQAAEEIGYPVMLKVSGAGGGIGMALLTTKDEVIKAYPSIKSRGKAYFGSEKVYVEKYIQNARHVEVQVFGDTSGQIVHLFERDCSVQRRNQKVIEETHSPSLSEQTRSKIVEAAIHAAQAVSYVNAGTVEFIVDEKENFYFLEMNTRLQVEHPITELVTGIDLVEWQILVAEGNVLPLKQEDISHQGHAMEFRLYAENPKTFYPSPGPIQLLKWGNGENVRIDSGYREGNQVSHYYDPLIAKIIFHGIDRHSCLRDAEHFFQTTEISGIQTNIPLFLQILHNPTFLSGHYSTNIVNTIQ